MADPAQQTFSEVQPIARQSFSNVTPIGSTQSPILPPSLTVGAPPTRAKTADAMKNVYLIGGEPTTPIPESVGKFAAGSVEQIPSVVNIAHRLLQHHGILQAGDLYPNEPTLADMPKNATIAFLTGADAEAEVPEIAPRVPKSTPSLSKLLPDKINALDLASFVPGHVGLAARILKKFGVGESAPEAPVAGPVSEFETLRRSGDFGTPQEMRGKVIPNSQPAAAAPVSTPAPTPAAVEAAPDAASGAESGTPSTATLPRTLSGDAALREVLVTQPNKVLLQIARSRGLDVTPEAQLKPTNAVNNRIINKVVDDFSEDELDDFRSTHLEVGRMGRHDFGDIGKEASQTLNLQTYFPDLKIPLAQVLRLRKAIASASAQKFAPVTDLSQTLKSNAKAVEPPKTISATAAKPQLDAAADDLSAILQESLKKVRAEKLAQTQ